MKTTYPRGKASFRLPVYVSASLTTGQKDGCSCRGETIPDRQASHGFPEWHAACIPSLRLLLVRIRTMTDTESRSISTPQATTADPPTNGGNLTGLVSGILDDAQKLLRQQVEMFKSEVREDFRRSKRAAEYGGMGIVLLDRRLLRPDHGDRELPARTVPVLDLGVVGDHGRGFPLGWRGPRDHELHPARTIQSTPRQDLQRSQGESVVANDQLTVADKSPEEIQARNEPRLAMP